MSTPQGPDRYGADRDPDRTGPPTWGTPPPGGWGGADPDADPGPPTGAWDERWDDGYDDRSAPTGYGDGGYGYGVQDSGGYVGRRRAEDREPWSGDAPWGDQADDQGYDRGRDYGDRGYGDRGYDGRTGGPDPWSDTGETVAVAPQQGGSFEPGDEPWAPREAVSTPWRGPGGLGAAATAGIGGGVVAVVVLAVLLFVAPGWLVTTTLDKTALQNGVTQILTQDYKLQVGAVECPDDVVAEADTEFTCQALVDGEQVAVPGKVTTDDGTYEISRV